MSDVKVSVVERHVEASAEIRNVLAAEISGRSVVVAEVAARRGPPGETGERGPPGTIGGDDPIIFDGGNF